jgi:hypothetical protein
MRGLAIERRWRAGSYLCSHRVRLLRNIHRAQLLTRPTVRSAV